MTTDVPGTFVAVLFCTQPHCDHTATIDLDDLDVYLCGSDAVCRCHPLTVSEALDVRPFDCAVSQVTWDRATEVSRW